MTEQTEVASSTLSARPGLLERTRRFRLALLLALLCVLGLWLIADRIGLLARVAPLEGALDERLQLGHGVTVERVRLNSPPCQLIVARVPRRTGLRLAAVRLAEVASGREDAPARLEPLGVVERLDALVAVNGDYHRLEGLCAGLPFSTLVRGQPAPGTAGKAMEVGDGWTLGSPFDYACALRLGTDGAPAIATLDLNAALRLPSGRALPVLVDLDYGPALLSLHPPAGRWSPPACAPDALPLVAGEGRGAWRVAGPWTRGELQGPALLVATVDDALRAETAAGAELRLEVTGRDAGLALAIGTGPRLVEAGEVPARLEENPGDATGWPARVARTAVALTDDHLLLVCTIQAPRQGLSYGDLARALRALGAKDALALDGGPSTALWAKGRIQNVPDPYAPNDVATALVVLPPGGEGVELR